MIEQPMPAEAISIFWALAPRGTTIPFSAMPVTLPPGENLLSISVSQRDVFKALPLGNPPHSLDYKLIVLRLQSATNVDGSTRMEWEKQ
jgi:hypothetical protein